MADDFSSSVENSPLTTDVHRCLTGADYIGLPEPHASPDSTDMTTSPIEDNTIDPETPHMGSPDSTDSLTNRVANLLNRSGEFQPESSMFSETKGQTPLVTSDHRVVATDSAETAVNFGAGSFLSSSRMVATSLTASPSKQGFSYYAQAGGSADDLIAPPVEFSDSSAPSSMARVPGTAGSNSAIQNLLKSLEWDHAWDTSFRAGSRPASKIAGGNMNFSIDSSGRTDQPQRSSPSPKGQPKRVLFDDSSVTMPPLKASVVPPSYTPSVSPDFNSGKYFSEMKHLVEEQMQRREALIGPLLHAELGASTSAYSNAGSSSYLGARNISVTSSTDTNVPPPISNGNLRFELNNRPFNYEYNLDLHSSRLPPPGPTRAASSSHLRTSALDLGGFSRYGSSDFRSRYLGTETGRLSTSQSDLTTVTRTGSAFSSHHHHHYDLSGVDVRARVAEILAQRSNSGASEEQTRSSSNQSGEATTLESTHPGSNDAIPPMFPRDIYGNRPARPYLSGVDSARSVKSSMSAARFDAAVQTSASRLPASWESKAESALPNMASSGVQTSTLYPNIPSNNVSTFTENSTTTTKSGVTVAAAPAIDGTGSLNLQAIASMLEEPIRAAVRKCLETELKGITTETQQHVSRPTSRTSVFERRSPSARSTQNVEVPVGDGRSSSVNRHLSVENELLQISSPSVADTFTTATGHIERMLETERRMAEAARLKADEQAKRVRRLEEVLAKQNPIKPPPTFDDYLENIENHELLRENYGRRSPSPSTSRQNRSFSPSQSPPKSPVSKPKRASPVAWFVPADPARVKKSSDIDSRKPAAVRMDFAAPGKKDHNYLTGRIQSMLDPVSPTKNRDELTLQDSLRLSNRNFIIRSAERLRRLRLHAIERKMADERKKASAAIDLERDDFLEEQGNKLNARETLEQARMAAFKERQGTYRVEKAKEKVSKSKTSDEMLFAELLACDTASIASTTPEMKRIRAETHRRAMLLPEALNRLQQERRALQAKQNRLRGEIFKQKVLNKLLGRRKWTLPGCLRSDNVIDRVLLR